MTVRRAMLMLGRLLRPRLALLFLMSGVFPACGQDQADDAQTCRLQLEPGGESTVLAVSSPLTLHLADGRQVHLAEVLSPASAEGAVLPGSPGATAYLRAHVLGHKVEVRFGGKRQDRYGAAVAHVFVAGGQPLWVQEGLISEGVALAFPQLDNHACFEQLARLEERARNANRGYWGLALFKILPARDARQLLSAVQTYQIIEGEIAFITHAGARTILHFSEDNPAGLTATIEPATLKRLSEQSLENWQGKPVHIRGWIERKKGPAVTITQPEQIELLRRQPTTPAFPKAQ